MSRAHSLLWGGALVILAGFAATPMRAVSLNINGPSSYQLQADGLTARITTRITNTGAVTSAALQVQLWAFALPYNAAAPAVGYKLATVDLPPLAAGAAANIATVALYSPPASGSWNVALFAEEAVGAAFVIRASFNFPDLLPVPATLAVYAATAVFGVPVPVNLENLLVDPSRVYWVRAGGDRIDSVALAPGSQPGIFTTLAGIGASLTMVQDAVNLYALIAPGAREGDIYRISKTSGAAVLMDTRGLRPADSPIAGPIGIRPQGGTLYFRGRRDLPGLNLVPSLISQMSAQGGSLFNYGTARPLTSWVNRSTPARIRSPPISRTSIGSMAGIGRSASCHSSAGKTPPCSSPTSRRARIF